MKATRSLQELAMEAVNVQNACNLCGVAQAFARAMVELSAHVNGTDEPQRSPDLDAVGGQDRPPDRDSARGDARGLRRLRVHHAARGVR